MAIQGSYRVMTSRGSGAREAVVEASRDGSWQVIQRWSLQFGPDSTVRRRRQRLEAAATEAGWSLPEGRWPRPNRAGRQILPLTPVDWWTILSKATSYRRTRIEEFIAMDQAWRGVLLDAVNVGSLGPAGAAQAADVTRWRVYQIIKDPGSTELVKVAEATVQQRPPRKPAGAGQAAAAEPTVVAGQAGGGSARG